MILQRVVATPHGTIGLLHIRGMKFYTIEEESLGNKPNVSCIPAGNYVCKRSMYHKGGYATFEITGVANRSRILFHIANTEEDVEGCIGLGTNVGIIDAKDEDTQRKGPKLGVVQSRLAFALFMGKLTGQDEFELEVKDPG